MHEDLRKVLDENPNKVLFLCGAGISLEAPTSLPTVNKFICDTLKECGISDETIERVCQCFSKTNYRFESLVDEIRKNHDIDLLLTKLFDSASFNKIHHFLSLMLKSGASIITTNFDNCIENACEFENINHINRFVYNGNDLDDNNKPLSGALIKIHGSQPLQNEAKGELVVTIKALAKTEKAFRSFPVWREYLLNLISGKIVVVLGYSCSDDFDIVPLLSESKPEKIVWINYNCSKSIPVLADIISNTKIKELAQKLPISYFDGKIIPLLNEWSRKHGFILNEMDNGMSLTIKDYISQLYKTQTEKYILCNEIFLSYGLYNEVIVIEKNPQLYLHKIKSAFRLGDYENAVALCKEVLDLDIPFKVLLETLYYLSSALYYKGEYEEAIEISKKCVAIGWNINDMDFYLNSLINFASIQYVYGSTLKNEDRQNELIQRAQRKYIIVQKMADGINIEAKANALWGLGDIERYKGNVFKSLAYLEEALVALKKIGNAYAISQLEKTIQEIQFECSNS